MEVHKDEEMITPENVIRHELIGLTAKVVRSKNKANVGVAGKIINETHHTLDVETPKGDKKLFKKSVTLRVTLPSKQVVEIDGPILEAKPWDRIKMR